MQCKYTNHLGHGCQFPIDRDEIVQWDGELWCPFHLPLECKKDWSGDEIAAFNRRVIGVVLRPPQSWTREVNLDGVVVPGDIRFDGEFGEVSFISAQFSGDVIFHHAQFSRDANFNDAQFSGNVFFPDAQFSRGADFSDAQFSRGANFADAQFSDFAVFDKARFRKHAFFSGVKFSGSAHFRNAQFSDIAYFRNAQFSRSAGFEDAQFSGATDFSTTANGDRNRTVQQIDFRRCHFHGNANFANREFQSSTDFSDTTFEGLATFHGCHLHQDTNFDGTVFKDTSSPGAARAYRTLRLTMEQHRARLEEGRFYALEQKALRHKSDIPRTYKLFSRLYEITSDYGRSALRPLACLATTTAAAALIYMHVLIPFLTVNDGGIPPGDVLVATLGKCVDFSTTQVVRPFSAWSRFGMDGLASLTTHHAPLVIVRVLALIQSLVSAALIGLFVLAVRWRFRRG